MDYDRAVSKYLELRRECEEIEAEARKAKAQRMEKMALLEAWITSKAQEEGLKTIPTNHGTAYWSTHYSSKVASREDFFNFVKENEAWDLLETRASKLAVKAFVDAYNVPPPGVDFSSIRVMNVRTASNKE